MKRVVQSIIAVCSLASVTPAGANLIRNGGFEDGTFGDGSVRVISHDDNPLSGWTVVDHPLAWYTTGYVPNPLKPIGVGPHSGDLAINMCDGSVAILCDGSVRPVSISQTFTILPFIEQQVSFWVGNYSGNGGPVSIRVTILDGTSNTILFSEIGGNVYAGLDDVSVVAIPEPSTWALALLGFAGLGMLGVHRRRLTPA
jgi:hypothetical protein